MTCCIAIEDGHNVWLAGDSAATDSESGEQEIATGPKVWATPNGWGFGFAGSWRVGMLLRHTLDPPKMRRDLDRIERYVCVELPRECRALLRDEADDELGTASVLIAHRGFVWCGALAAFSLTRSAYGYCAIGVGGALPALAATDKLSPRVRALRVLGCMAKHDCNVRPPFTVVRV